MYTSGDGIGLTNPSLVGWGLTPRDILSDVELFL